VVGARFRPGAWAGVLGVDANELQDRHVPLRDVAPALAQRFSTAVADQAAPGGRLAVAGRSSRGTCPTRRRWIR
jgi:hypothetical protein